MLEKVGLLPKDNFEMINKAWVRDYSLIVSTYHPLAPMLI